MTAKPSPGRSGWRRALGGGSLLSTHVPLFGPATCSVCTAACGTMGGNGTSPESSRNSQAHREAAGARPGEAQGRDTQAGPPGGELSTAEGPRQRGTNPVLPQTVCVCPLPGKAFCFGKAKRPHSLVPPSQDTKRCSSASWGARAQVQRGGHLLALHITDQDSSPASPMVP